MTQDDEPVLLLAQVCTIAETHDTHAKSIKQVMFNEKRAMIKLGEQKDHDETRLQEVHAREELSRRDEILAESVREKEELEERLKWRSEQFRHLEEAYDRAKERLRRREREWETEHSDLFDGMSSLQSRLDSETRIAEDLRSRLEMCSQALAHEEGRMKALEAQVSESKVLYKNVVSEFEETRSSIASRNAHLEEENRELKNLQQRLQFLEQVHRVCAAKLQAKEAESEKLGKELDECLLKLDFKVDALKQELETAKAAEDKLAVMKMLVEKLSAEVDDAKRAELDAVKQAQEWKKKAEPIEAHLVESKQQEKFAMESLASISKKKRRATVVRDFPPGCGRNAPKLGTEQELGVINLNQI